MKDILPWYKQFWPWFLIFVPAITVVVCAMLIYVAVDTEDSIVVDDYYKKGKAINLELSKINAAKQLDIQIGLKTQQQELKVNFVSGNVAHPLPLRATFYHPTLEDRDFMVNLTADASGGYSAPLPEHAKGNWRITLTPFDQSWKLQTKVALPSSSEILIAP
jgi:hypothetical protein